MDQSALRQTADEITIANLRSLLNVQTELRDQSERRAHEAVIAFQDLLQTLAPEESERLQRAGASINRYPLDNWPTSFVPKPANWSVTWPGCSAHRSKTQKLLYRKPIPRTHCYGAN